MKLILVTAALAVSASPVLAQPGGMGSGCVGKVLLPPLATLRTERVLETPGHVKRLYHPPVVERSGRQVMVRPAREERIDLPPLYRIERRLVSTPGPTRWVHEPDRYADVAEQVLVAPGHYVWERRDGPMASGPPQPGQTMVTPTGVVMCKVWCPARYAMATHRVRVAAGRVFGERTMVQHELVRRVMVRPAGYATRIAPAEYRWLSTSHVVRSGGFEVRRVPAQYGLRTAREMHDGGTAYAPVVCGGPLSRPAMARMQASLAANGYDPGAQDGIGRPETYAALHRFQVEHRLAAGQVTVESARALGVIP